MSRELKTGLTEEYLKSKLEYDPESGKLTWKVARGGKRVGDVAGSLNDQGYIVIRLNFVSYRAHRLAWFIMTGSPPDNEIDHEDGDRSNNRWSNLRDVTRLDNKRNLGRVITNSSGVTGVMWYKASSKWHAQITIEGKAIHLGYFESLDDAVQARKAAEEFYGFHDQHGKKDSWNRRNSLDIPNTIAYHCADVLNK